MTTATTSCCDEIPATQQVLLLTAMVDIMDRNNKAHPCRVLLDSSSQANLISKEIIDSLNLRRFPSNVTVAGVNSTKSHSSYGSIVQIRSRYSSFIANLKCLITERVTADVPTSPINVGLWEIPPGIQLADPSFHQTRKVDMLIGNQLFPKLLLPGQIQLNDHAAILKETRLGWVVGGGYQTDPNVHSYPLTLEQSIQRFWEVEELPGDHQVKN
ncbi:uncharacterized protein LOC129720008 [Wyeomyia smithii]|uniref:uncharacterized protein LOC129720008 n=1 Tax=Wyeomyia smithii TaxID=174621 RepID=UPI002467B63E|nr:uncharacterized protein LOC129720008 [Wyeomyia smithii]